ncbi:MAG: nucleotidyltransferase family protein, partial [Trueperaceae bacterium]
MERERNAPAAEHASRDEVGARATSELPTARALVPPVLDALRRRDPELLATTLADGSATTDLALRHVLTTQGLAPLIADIVASTASASEPAPADPDGTAGWLALQLQQNRVRSSLFAADLSAILAEASASGLPVMPLKGSLLAFTRYRDPGLRPMADLDLLIRPADERGVHELLGRLGYDLVRREHRHIVFRRPGDRVVAMDGTHPGNPRPVEIHTRLRRSVWADRGGVDIAPYLWAAGR